MRPSPRQAGIETTCGTRVSRCMAPPSRRITYRLEERLPGSWRTKAIRRRSGDQSGSLSPPPLVTCRSPT